MREVGGNNLSKIKVMSLRVGEPEGEVFDMEHSLEEMQKVVDGWLESLRLTETCTMWINEEGKLRDDLQRNFLLLDRGHNPIDEVKGDVLFTGLDEEGNTVGLSDIDLHVIQKRFPIREGFIYYA